MAQARVNFFLGFSGFCETVRVQGFLRGGPSRNPRRRYYQEIDRTEEGDRTHIKDVVFLSEQGLSHFLASEGDGEEARCI
jgi:hypothetical protein